MKPEKKLTLFVLRYWEKNKRVPCLREMCDALGFSTRHQVSTLLHKMRSGSPLVARKKNVIADNSGCTEEWRNAWKQRKYLRYRPLKNPRNFIGCYMKRTEK